MSFASIVFKNSIGKKHWKTTLGTKISFLRDVCSINALADLFAATVEFPEFYVILFQPILDTRTSKL